jgi:hypothetical protein
VKALKSTFFFKIIKNATFRYYNKTIAVKEQLKGAEGGMIIPHRCVYKNAILIGSAENCDTTTVLVPAID